VDAIQKRKKQLIGRPRAAFSYRNFGNYERKGCTESNVWYREGTCFKKAKGSEKGVFLCHAPAIFLLDCHCFHF
jgi:hypothetical protein